ncbi:MAG: hypothetical protein KTR18_06510 [Acidiferrobacterales bacterium]|nr:hypothetical protein [Acidiferrobacterales bacterium]
MTKNSSISPHSVIDDDCVIGENVTIEEFVSVINGSIIGDNCTLRSGCKIGAPSFNFSGSKDERIRKPDFGKVVIKNNTEIGYNTVVQQGVEHDTVIGEHSVVNNLCNIGHDVTIGNYATIGFGSRISGHTKVGDSVYIGPGVTVMNRVRIGSNTQLGIGCLVLHDVNDGEIVAGRPAIPVDEFRQERAALKNLLQLEQSNRVISTKKRRWSKVASRWITSVRQKYFTW